MIKYLSQWIKHNVAIMSDRSFPNNPVELKVLSIAFLELDHQLVLQTAFTLHMVSVRRLCFRQTACRVCLSQK